MKVNNVWSCKECISTGAISDICYNVGKFCMWYGGLLVCRLHHKSECTWCKMMRSLWPSCSKSPRTFWEALRWLLPAYNCATWIIKLFKLYLTHISILRNTFHSHHFLFWTERVFLKSNISVCHTIHSMLKQLFNIYYYYYYSNLCIYMFDVINFLKKH